MEQVLGPLGDLKIPLKQTNQSSVIMLRALQRGAYVPGEKTWHGFQASLLFSLFSMWKQKMGNKHRSTQAWFMQLGWAEMSAIHIPATFPQKMFVLCFVSSSHQYHLTQDRVKNQTGAFWDQDKTKGPKGERSRTNATIVIITIMAWLSIYYSSLEDQKVGLKSHTIHT